MNVLEVERFLGAYLPPTEASVRAQHLVADLRAIGFTLAVSGDVADAQWRSLGAIPQTEYVLPTTSFSINAKDDCKAMEGSFLTRGNLLRLSQAVMLGRKWLPQHWPHDFSDRLLGAEHLDALNEIWWLKFWRGIAAVQRGRKANLAAPDVDWLIEIHDGLARLRINLEVKRRTGNINTLFKHRNPSLSLADISHKFEISQPDAANVVALTIYHRPERAALRWVSEWLEKQRNVDGVLVWVEGNLGGDPLLSFFKAEKKWAEYLLAPVDREDLKVAGHALGALCREYDVLEFLPKFVDSIRRENGMPT